MKHHYLYIPKEKSEERDSHVAERYKQLHGLAKDAGNSAAQYLFATNSSGIGVTLTYLGLLAESTTSSESVLVAKISLIFFTLGLILVGLYRATIVHLYEQMFYVFHEAASDYYRDEDWENLKRIDELSLGKHNLPYIFAYGAFTCFVIGSLIGGVAIAFA